MIAYLEIKLPPITKKNSQRILKGKGGRPFIAPSEKYKVYEAAAGAYLEWWDDPIDEPVNVMCVYYMPTRRRVDLVNLQEATLDTLVKHGILKDDNCGIVVSMDGSRVKYDKQNPRTEITIEEAEGYGNE